jgi:hypothetical protein
VSAGRREAECDEGEHASCTDQSCPVVQAEGRRQTTHKRIEVMGGWALRCGLPRPSQHRWTDQADEVTCPTCLALDGRTSADASEVPRG